ncbi:uncharacterized protein LOC141697073 isoform X2 [Apium graveolens]|uniref:uncharacterized protein LOC141697073 isoform X2 n=1 Tax=Apium graveolens TaxID=4045 RepID=UPI003D796246
MMSGNYTSIDNQNVSGSVPAVSDSPAQISVKFSDSDLQTFPPSGSQGKISKASGPPRDADDTFSKPRPGSSDESQSGGWFRAFTVGAYKPYFDVDTSDVLDRIKDSVLPFSGIFNEKNSDRPDLFGDVCIFVITECDVVYDSQYHEFCSPTRKSIIWISAFYSFSYGPFWICTTLIFVAAAIGTFVTYLAHKLKNQEWEYDINLVTWSAGLFYGYVLVVPICLYVILKYFSAPSGLAQLLCLYGYSLFVFIPALCLSVIPVDLFRWVIAGVAGVMSASFVALNLRNHIKSAGERWFLIVAGIFLLQLALSLVLKLYLFTVSV